MTPAEPVLTLFEKSRPGRRASLPPAIDVPVDTLESILPEHLRRAEPAELPEVTELQICRHYVLLSRRLMSIDSNFYPLGSCTMKYNPKVNEAVANSSGLPWLHPYQPEESCQGLLGMFKELEGMLASISGLPWVSLQPAAGAHGELTSLFMIRKFLHERDGSEKRIEVLIPDSAHGTNPASVTFAGLKPVEIPSTETGMVNLETLKEKLSDQTAALMITNPSTLGLFEENIVEICRMVHEAGGLVYLDGANMNALVGRTRPGNFGADIMHYNLHKTFSTPHGGGGPGAGPIACIDDLKPYLPVPRLEPDNDDILRWTNDHPKSVGRVKGFFGNTGILVRAWTYLRSHSGEDLRGISGHAVLNANYLRARLRDRYELPHGDRPCMHEFVLSGSRMKKETGVRTLDIGKRLLDYGFHAPTIYFPLIVPEAIMIEPTETETREILDAFADAMLSIADEARTEPDLVKTAPHETPVRRLDEVTAARHPCLCFTPPQED